MNIDNQTSVKMYSRHVELDCTVGNMDSRDQSAAQPYIWISKAYILAW